MRQQGTIYYVLFVLLILGGFASMAQNDYGVVILGLVATSFSLIFLGQLIAGFIRSSKKNWLRLTELSSLTILTAVMALRVFHIHFRFIELVFGLAGIVLIAVYFRRLIQSHSKLVPNSKRAALLKALFYSSIVLYLFSMI